MSPYAIAWTVVVVSGSLCGWLVFRALRRFTWLRYVPTALVLVWAVTPYRFDAEHWAPAFLVAAFRLPFIDEDANPADAIMVLGATTAGVVIAAVLLMVSRALLAKRRKHASGATPEPEARMPNGPRPQPDC